MKTLTAMDLTELKGKIANLATAREAPVVWVNEQADNSPVAMPEHKVIINNKTGKVEAITSKGYVIIQHSKAFEAALDALTAAKEGSRFRASVSEQGGRAWMNIVYEDAVANDGKQGIQIGVSISNSYDKTSSLRFGGSQANFQNKGGEMTLGFYGLRLVCNNGMSIRVPISLADLSRNGVKNKVGAVSGDIIGVEAGEEIAFMEPKRTEYSNEKRISGSVRHYGKDVELNLDRLNQMVLALPQVAKLLEAKIALVSAISMDRKEAELRLAEIGFGELVCRRIMARFAEEEKTQWGLYNAITAYATHEEKVSPRSMEVSLRKAELLMEVVN